MKMSALVRRFVKSEIIKRLQRHKASKEAVVRKFRTTASDGKNYNVLYKIVQNKLHYAAHGHTAAEVIYERADAEKPLAIYQLMVDIFKFPQLFCHGLLTVLA